MSKKTEMATEQSVADVNSAFPVDTGSYAQTQLPRLGMVSQDKTEGKGKAMKVTVEAGTFFIEHSTDEKDEQGKTVWNRKELGDEIEATIIYSRKQLRMFDEATETFSSTPIYDTEDEILPLWANKAEVDRGTPAELKARYMGVSKKTGKPVSDLKDNKILYVLYEGELYQLNIWGSSMYSFKDYQRKARPGVPSVLTHFTSSSEENGAVTWNKMQFSAERPLDQEELDEVKEKQTE